MAKKVGFNPIKEEEGDVRAKRIIWSTESLNAAIKGIELGKKLKANPFYENNTKLLKADLVFERTDEEIAEWKKCKNDILYFANKYCKLMTPEGIQHIQLRDYQEEYLEHLVKNRLSILLAARQIGKTVTSALFMLHYLCFNFDKNTYVLGDRRSTSVEILDKLKKIFIELPFFLRPGVQKWNESEVVFDNGCKCKSEATTVNSLIGTTAHCVLADEFAHIAPNIQEKFYNNLFPVITAGRARFMITSTQNGYELFYRLYQSAVAGESEYKAFKVDWYQVPEWNPDTHQWEPRTEEWKALQVANLGGEEAFNKQFGTSFDISAPTLISQKKLRKYQQDLVEFVNKDIPGVICSDNWYWHPDIDPMDLKNTHMIITCDLAEGGEGDSTVFSVYRLINSGLECIGYFKSNSTSRDKCALSLCLFCCIWAHPERCLVSVEYNTYGEVFLKDIAAASEAVPQCAKWDPSILVKYYNDSGTKWKHGIKLTPSNKTPHCILFKESFERDGIINKSTSFALELANFCDDGTGHYEASYGHDDLVMTAVQLEFVKETLQYKYMRDDFAMGMGAQEDTIWNPYDTSGYEPNILYDEYGNAINTNYTRLK